MNWQDGSPKKSDSNINRCYVLEFPEGDRFEVVRLISYPEEYDEPCLMSLSDGGIVSDEPKRFFPIPDPGNDKRMH